MPNDGPGDHEGDARHHCEWQHGGAGNQQHAENDQHRQKYEQEHRFLSSPVSIFSDDLPLRRAGSGRAEGINRVRDFFLCFTRFPPGPASGVEPLGRTGLMALTDGTGGGLRYGT
jgi:hypothetical protein